MTLAVWCRLASLLLLFWPAICVVPAFHEDELVLWVDQERAFRGIRKVGRLYQKKTGVRVVIKTPEELEKAFQQAAAAQGGPDIVFWTHDLLGLWAKKKWIAAIEPSTNVYQRINNLAWEAVTVEEQVYAYPISMDAVSLIYNKNMVSSAAHSFEEMFRLRGQLVKKYGIGVTSISWNLSEPANTMPMLLTNGGYIFKRTHAGFNAAKTGINNSGALTGAKMLFQLVDREVILDPEDDDAFFQFVQGQTAMIIDGFWCWSKLDQTVADGKKLDYGIAPLPTLGGAKVHPIVTVWSAAINQFSPNKATATDFIENYLLVEQGLRAMNRDVLLGISADKSFMNELMADKRIKTVYSSVMDGYLVPNVPEMERFWPVMRSAFGSIASGQKGYKKALDEAAELLASGESDDRL